MTNSSHPPSCLCLGTGILFLTQETQHSSLTSRKAHPASICPGCPPSAFPVLAGRSVSFPYYSVRHQAHLPPANGFQQPSCCSAPTVPNPSLSESVFTLYLTRLGYSELLLCTGKGLPKCLWSTRVRGWPASSSQVTEKCFMGIPRPFHPVLPSAISLANV